jgi:hypothetical protein
MIPCVRVKSGVTFAAVIGAYEGTIAPAGFVLLSAIWKASQVIQHDLTITSGTDGCHSGTTDPHHSAEAYDVRTHDLTAEQKALALKTIQDEAGPLFFAFLEAAGTDNEHIHAQRKKGTTYPPTNAEQVQDATAGEN